MGALTPQRLPDPHTALETDPSGLRNPHLLRPNPCEKQAASGADSRPHPSPPTITSGRSRPATKKSPLISQPTFTFHTPDHPFPRPKPSAPHFREEVRRQTLTVRAERKNLHPTASKRNRLEAADRVSKTCRENFSSPTTEPRGRPRIPDTCGNGAAFVGRRIVSRSIRSSGGITDGANRFGHVWRGR